MATQIEPPPTYADVVIIVRGKPQFNPIWLKWFLNLAAILSNAGAGGGAGIQHNSLGGLQGGTAGQEYHLTSAAYTALVAALANQSANLVFAGPGSGAAAAPSFRSLVDADLPGGVTGTGAVVKVTGPTLSGPKADWKAADGTAGASMTITLATTTTIVVKNGLVTSIT